ncbi:hypothetical protein CONPUDRAFT_46313 [Coniophora puteana RWD-64-598 SS2]|uniref:Protein kinase domain-containing protein n=1 Tax=Coniophora puteana (strain RWD-64-598) TaxID=741705 RepID=A0A5M3N7P2_CONPW|nr:uncharacterized protein CONPUDRAFT_46313 [Coniophora puteana RWD-64-598 SS2]EIW87470.1 hypothetical protein CONPUDRAFT_46313 [Coniophora puteana RWD-64-598 SS2]
MVRIRILTHFFILQLIETPPCHRSGTRRLFTDALFKLAQRSGCYPQILLLKDVEVSQNDPIGVGGFGTVYQGRYKGQAVAIKHLRDFSSKRAQKCARELVIWACMEHPNVLNFYGVYLLNGLDSSACLVSPLMENGNLVQYLNHSPDAIRESLLYDISLGLEYLHTQSIIHGDMKPENVFVALDGRACIGDYGLASVNSASQNWTTKSRSLNSGTLRYQAPELFKDAQIGRATDMYAFGCIIYEVSQITTWLVVQPPLTKNYERSEGYYRKQAIPPIRTRRCGSDCGRWGRVYDYP